jgi:hypothetical protein
MKIPLNSSLSIARSWIWIDKNCLRFAKHIKQLQNKLSKRYLIRQELRSDPCSIQRQSFKKLHCIYVYRVTLLLI